MRRVSSQVVFSAQATKTCVALGRRMIERIDDALALLALEGRGDVKRLKGLPEVYRLRVGEYRVIFRFNDDTAEIEVAAILPRSGAYR